MGPYLGIFLQQYNYRQNAIQSSLRSDFFQKFTDFLTQSEKKISVVWSFDKTDQIQGFPR